MDQKSRRVAGIKRQMFHARSPFDLEGDAEQK
jgi:hypothetical protein